jgi:YbaB/EbfC DNA-binding family
MSNEDEKSASDAPREMPRVTEEALRVLSGEGFSPVRAEADDLAAATVDANFQVVSIELLGTAADLTDDARERLERAVASAVNEAIQEVGRRNAQLLLRATGQTGA